MNRSAEGYPSPEFTDPYPYGYLYAGLSVDPPRAPLVRRSAERDDALEHCRSLAGRLEARTDVVRARVFETVLIPPLKGVPRFDVLVLVEAAAPDALPGVRADEAFQEIGADLVMPAYNSVRIGDTEDPASGTYLFNHFTAADGEAALRAWEDLAGWYTAKAGVDNSAPLVPLEDARFAFVNYVRLPGGAAAFMADQLLRPSFHRFVRGRLKENGMAALPLICRPR
ncbi:hypothetical protein GCM10023224_07930 [Streptomonospora halophila]|uniref:Uncharacterized protein n=1 Tax=Streptomonospora halophila TaxID=427369 RepID=A0ABP9GDH3_9ACTN